jgi:peptide-methionine (S)-S-oxide reductase
VREWAGMPEETTNRREIATVAGGCFWCTEAVFQRLRGVEKVVSGYTGGSVEDPTYNEVSSGMTGHAEAVQVTFDPSVISYEQLLEVFFETHDPTTPNRQGYDVGTQYRSAVYYHDDEQRETAERVIAAVNASGMYPDPVVTELEPLDRFYEAENYHQNFYNQNESYPYCQIIINPKLEKLFKKFGELTSSPSA